MREWILKNTDVTAEEYDELINQETIYIEGKSTGKKHLGPKKIFEHPLVGIDYFTFEKPSIQRMLKYRVKKVKNYYYHQNIKFYILSELIKNMQESLYSIDRIQGCFELSFDICQRVNNSKIVTALCINPFFKKEDIVLHSFVVVTNDDGMEYACDGTLNCSLEKETYLKLLNVTTIISEIPREDMITAFEFLKEKDILKYLIYPEFYCFKDRIIEGLKKLTKSKSNQ